MPALSQERAHQHDEYQHQCCKQKMKYKLHYNLTFFFSHNQLVYVSSSFILFWKTVFNLHFDVFIHSSIMSQLMTASAPMPASNIPALIQSYCSYCIYQIAYLADICNMTDVCWCDYCHLLNKHCWLVSSMQDIKELLMLKRFCQPSMSLPITSSVNTVAPTIRQHPKVTATATLCFRMQPRWLSPVSFKLTKWPPQNTVRLYLQHACMSQL